MLLIVFVLWDLLGCIAVRHRGLVLEECKKRPDIVARTREMSLSLPNNKTLMARVLLAEFLACVENYMPRYYVFCEDKSQVRRIKKSELAAVAWNSPLRLTEVNCGPQDEKLASVDLSSLARPDWVRRLKAPVGRCPTRFVPVDDPTRTWPQTLIGVECACEKSRCTLAGPHRCLTVYILKIVLVSSSYRLAERFIPIDCLCAAQTATFVKNSSPQMVT